jgi:hypothetical protein
MATHEDMRILISLSDKRDEGAIRCDPRGTRNGDIYHLRTLRPDLQTQTEKPAVLQRALPSERSSGGDTLKGVM